jgi:hypothetical protein
MLEQHHEDGYDDGLVHGHRWATEPFRPTATLEHLLTSWPEDEAYDDGLVHGHAWAMQDSSLS